MKYLFAFLIPLAAFTGLQLQSWYAPGSFYLAFVLIPILELIFPIDTGNDSVDTGEMKRKNIFFDVILFMNLPVLYLLIYYFLIILQSQNLQISTLLMLVLNLGICTGVMGINIAHELGHRSGFINKLCAQVLLIPACYMHFTAEHNHWHHKYVATPNDPSSARLNESLFHFWFRSIFGVFKNAINIEIKRLKLKQHGFIHWSNRILWQLMIQIIYLGLCFQIAGYIGLVSAIGIALISILLLESINYIEHYGLQRLKPESRDFEPVNEMHSWNSDHVLGRIFLYELTRHPHHHKRASVKYQNLESHSKSPTLPYGYPACILLALIPPIWFKQMNPKIKALNPPYFKNN